MYLVEVLPIDVLIMAIHSKDKKIVQHLYNVGPASKTLGQRCINIVKMFSVCWVPPTMNWHQEFFSYFLFFFIKK